MCPARFFSYARTHALACISSMFLMGPVEQLKSMFSADRWGATTVYLATVVRVSADSHRVFSPLVSFASANCPILKWFLSSFSLGFPVRLRDRS